MHGAAGLQQFPAGADVGSAFPVPVEIRTGEDAVLPIALLPHRDVRDDFLLLDQPAEELARPIGCVRGEPPRPQIEALFCSIQHRLGRGNFIVGASRRRLDIDDHGILDVDEVVQPISELHALVGLGCPCRLWVRRRDHLGRLARITALSFARGSTALIWGIAFSRRFGFECHKILSHRTLLPLLLSPIEFIRRLAVITARVRLHDARIHGNPSPLTRPVTIAAMTTRSKIWRRISLSRNRFSRFSENVEWWGTASLRSSRQNHLYARWSLTSSHSFLSERMPKQ